jgi:hypothetical protein
MIVKRIWITKKHTWEQKTCTGYIEKDWVGYFLFGFIPLYIQQNKYFKKTY